jgi:ubiquinone/menaquinone biosynthesis C-methylase UbiE
VEAFDERSAGYEQGWLGRLHHEIADRTADVALAVAPSPARILDVGCGTGYLLRLLASRYPEAAELAGVDPAPGMIKVAAASAAPGVPGVPGAPAVPGAPGVPGAPAGDERLKFSAGVAEQLPYQDGSFDLVVSVTSFDHWSDQLAGLRECHRVLVPGGHLVLVDQLSSWLVPTLIFSRSGKARTKGRAGRLVGAAGFGSVAWHGVYAVIINAVTATA